MERVRRRSNVPDDHRKTQILEAAIRVIDREGVAAATTRRIAAEAGVPHGAFHYWFADKQELLESVLRFTLTDLRSAAVAGGPGATPAQSMLARLRAVFEAARADGPGRQLASYELTVLALRTPELRGLATEQYRAYRLASLAALEGWQQSVRGDVDTIAALLGVVVDGLILSWLADPDGTPVDAVLQLVSELLTAQPAAEASGG